MSVSNRVTQSASSAGASGSLTGPPANIQAPELPTMAPPSFPTSATHFSTIQSDVRAGAIRVEISDPSTMVIWRYSHLAESRSKTGRRDRKLDL